jgi:hypothetical protein
MLCWTWSRAWMMQLLRKRKEGGFPQVKKFRNESGIYRGAQ